jgi:ATP-binding cassette subfamily C (CFTR/MRP) protein 4
VIGLISWLNPWSFIPTVIAAIAMIYIRYRFAPCLRDLKRLEGTTRSPFYSYLTSTINGLKVIRSYHAEKICLSEFFFHVDNNTRADYLFAITTRWVSIRLDWITLFFILAVSSLAVIVRIAGRQFSAADVALTLSYSLSLMCLLQWTIRFVSKNTSRVIYL